MRGIVKASAGKGLEFRTDLPIPVPGDDEVLMKIRCASICGTDLGIYDWGAWAQKRIKTFPRTIGHETTGEIVEIGKNVKDRFVGQRVSVETHIWDGTCPHCRAGNRHICQHMTLYGIQTDGAFAEYSTVRADATYVLDDALTDEQGCIFEPMGSGVHGVEEAEVAGKTGTSWVILTPQEQKGSTDPYSDKWGRKKNQATFVCFFPADEPRYTALVTLYSKLSSRTFYGGTLPALAMLDIVNGIHALDNSQAEPLSSKAQAPSMGREIEFEQAKAGKSSPVPDLKGLGLKDAIYAIENSGYRCSYSGSGHVSSQSPAPGKAAAPGSTVTITLQ